MAQILSTITCDLGRGSCTPSSVRVMQYDSDIRYIAVKFLDKGQAWNVPVGYAVKLRMMKSDGTRICWNGMVKRAAVDLWDTPENAPDTAPTLWEDIQYKQGYRIIPEVITAGQAFALGELGWWGDSLYKSLLSSNVWTPEGYPAGWEKQEE